MPGDVTEVVRRATRDDIPGLAALFLEVFREEREERVWSWKFFDEARPGASFVCEAGGRIVAHCGGTPVRFRDGSSEYPAFQSVDFMSSSAYAGGIGGGGVFVRTVHEFFRQMCGEGGKAQLVYGFPGERHRLLGERLLGYSPIEPVGELSLDSTAANISPDELTEKVLSSFDKGQFPLGGVRDRPYLRWRYLTHPVHRYTYLAMRSTFFGSKVAAILRETDQCFYLMELGGELTTGALRTLASSLRRLGKPVRGWFSPGHRLAFALREAGFTFRERDHYLECRYFSKRLQPRSGEFYYTLGDYDVF